MRPYHWRNSYDDAIADNRNPSVTRRELCQHTGLLSDEVADIIDRLTARGLIERPAPVKADACYAPSRRRVSMTR